MNTRKTSVKDLAFYALLVVVIMWFFHTCMRKSLYGINTTPVEIKGSDKAPGDIFKLPYKLECAPGPDSTSALYTKSLTPGGICGGMKFVDAQATYEIIN